MSSDGTQELRQFALEAMSLEDASVSLDDEGRVALVTYASHDGSAEIDAQPVHDLARKLDLAVKTSVANFEAEYVAVEVVPR